MSKEQAVIEIRNSAIKLLVGYLNDNEGKVNLLYNETIPLEADILGALTNDIAKGPCFKPAVVSVDNGA